MIKQIIKFNHVDMITLYHRGFTDYGINRKIEQALEINANDTVELLEMYVENFDNNITNSDDVLEGFLHAGHGKNPYDSYCCNLQEHIFYEKEPILIKLLEDRELFKEICRFVKSWTGYDLLQNPCSIGNILIFEPLAFDLTITNHDEHRIFLYCDGLCHKDWVVIVKFKLYDLIVDVQAHKINRCLEINTTKLWNKMDIEVYSECQSLIYAKYNIGFLRKIQLSVDYVTGCAAAKLLTTGQNVTISNVSTVETIVGDSESKRLKEYLAENKFVARKLAERKFFRFFARNQREQAFNVLVDLSNQSYYSEMWIFDPYFINYNVIGGKDNLTDVLVVLSANASLTKHIVFVAKEERIEDDFREFLEIVHAAKAVMKKLKDEFINFWFYGTEEDFHDRFIFLRNQNGDLKGYMLGTSLNSLGTNYSAVLELDSEDAMEIFDSLRQGVLNSKSKVLEKYL